MIVRATSGSLRPEARAPDPRCYPRDMYGPGPYGVSAPRILIVDDDPNLLVILAEQLSADGYQVQTARDGDEALRRLAQAWPDLLIIDMLMPRMDGLSLAREVKNRADLPIIVLSAIDTADSKADLLDEVAEDYVTKPYHYPELRARITRVLRRLGDRVPRQRLELGPNLALELHRREAIVAGTPVSLTPDRVPPALRAGREPRPDRHDRHAPRPRLGRHRGRRPELRLGHDAPAAAEGRGRPEQAGPPPHGPRDRVPARRRERGRRHVTEGGRLSERLSRAEAARRAAAAQRGDTPDAVAGASPSIPTATATRDEDALASEPSGASLPVYRSSGLGFRTRLTMALVAAAVLPVAGFGIVVLVVADDGLRGHDARAGAAARGDARRSCSPCCSPRSSRRTSASRCGRSRGRWSRSRRATWRPASSSPATTSSAGSPRATTGWRATSPGATGSCAASWSRSRRPTSSSDRTSSPTAPPARRARRSA